MTFCAQCKQDICKKGPPEGCCGASQLYGALMFSKSFDRSLIHVASEHGFVIDHLIECLEEFGINEADIETGSNSREKFFKITNPEVIDRIMSDYGYSGDEPNLRINRDNFMCEKCAYAFVAGCFLTGGTITTPNTGYHLEFSSHRRNLIADFSAFLSEQGFLPKETVRGYSKVLYFKDSAQIEDMLTFMGAQHSSFELMNTKIYKELVNRVNRRTNCESANIDKIVTSSARDREAIKYIFATAGEKHLSDELLEIAKLRLEQPELSLEELGASLKTKLTKSGSSHRLRKIRAEAQHLKELQK